MRRTTPTTTVTTTTAIQNEISVRYFPISLSRKTCDTAAIRRLPREHSRQTLECELMQDSYSVAFASFRYLQELACLPVVERANACMFEIADLIPLVSLNNTTTMMMPTIACTNFATVLFADRAIAIMTNATIASAPITRLFIGQLLAEFPPYLQFRYRAIDR